MIKCKLILVVTLQLFVGVLTFAQQVNGKILSAATNEPVPFAKVSFQDLGIVVLTNEQGYWSVTDLNAATYTVNVSAVGYETWVNEIDLTTADTIQIYLTESHRQLDKIIVSNNGVLQQESITNVEAHKLSDINAIPTTTIGEAIANIPGVSETGIGAGIRKPVIRGLSGSSVVTYVNGLRIQNQQWGSDHGLPITSLGIGSVEVIKGSASLLYGADALGGVIYFVDEAYAPQNTYSVQAQSRFEHNSLGTSNELGFKFAKQKIKVNAFVGYDNFADYGVPSGNQILNSRFKQTSGKLAVGYNYKNWVTNLRYNFYHGRIGLPGHTHDAVPEPSSFQTTNQNRKNNIPAQVIQNHFIALENKLFLGKNQLELTVGNTTNGLTELEEKFTVPAIVMNLNNTLYNAKWKHAFNRRFNLVVGSQGMLQQNKNSINAEEFLIPNAVTTDVGAYALFTVGLEKWRFQFGGRLDNRAIKASETSTTFDAFEQNYQGFNYSGGVARMGEQSTLRFNVSSGFRAPTLTELSSDGVHHGAFRYEIGNLNLIPEKAVQIDASFGFHFEDLEIVINPFFNYIQNYIYLEQVDSTIDQFNVYEYAQADFAQLYGVDAGFHYHPHGAHWLHIESNISNVFAEDENRNPLPLIPQTRINTQLRFEIKTKGKFQLTDIVVQHLYFFEQNRNSNLETPTADYMLLNAAVNGKIGVKNPFLLTAGVRNALNQPYINHLSGLKSLGIQNPGINIFFSIKYEFQHKLK